MNERGENPSIWIRLGTVGHSSPSAQAQLRRGLRSGMEGPRPRISGARGRGAVSLPACLPACATNVTWDAPSVFGLQLECLASTFSRLLHEWRET